LSEGPPSEEEGLELLIGWIRAGHKLKALGRDLGAVTEGGGGSWGVLHTLAMQGPQTVPQIARARPVSRQHIQTIANGLIAEGLIESVDNPAHRRSRLLSLTPLGRARYENLRAAILDRCRVLFEGVRDADVAASRRLLALVLDRLDTLLEEGSSRTREHRED
jgi:DNA-binding MarR family transcriptional regulator